MPDASRPRILIADDHVLVADAFKTLLKAHFDVVSTVYDGRSLIESALALSPDVVLADIGMPLLNGLEAAERIKKLKPEVKVILITVSCDPALEEEAFRRGASGYLSKTSAAGELITAINRVFAGGTYSASRSAPAHETIVAPIADGMTPRSDQAHGPLTDRQLEVLQLLAEGRSMKEAAWVLKLTPRTVAYHKYRLMKRLDLRSDADVVQYALKSHVLFS
jgi:DNA-binding NarL/FixJ family response regulator